MKSRMHRVAATAIGLSCAAALVVAGAGSSQAAPTTSSTSRVPTGLDDIKRDGAKAIADREAQLTKLSGRLGSAPNCDASGKIAGVIAADGPALTALGTKLAADTTVADARADARSIFDDFRIYLVVTPQTYVASACGHISQATMTLTSDETTLSARVQAAAAAGADMSDATAALGDMTSKLTAASTAGNDANATLSAIGPDHGDKTVEASNKAAVESAKQDLQSAHTSLTAALDDAKKVVADLQAVK